MSVAIVYQCKRTGSWRYCPEWQPFEKSAGAVLLVAMRGSYFGQSMAVSWHDYKIVRVTPPMIDDAIEKVFAIDKWFADEPTGKSTPATLRGKRMSHWWDEHNAAVREMRRAGVLSLHRAIRKHIDSPPRKAPPRIIWMADDAGKTRVSLNQRDRGSRPQGGMGGGSWDNVVRAYESSMDGRAA